MTSRLPSVCASCAHYDAGKCPAFPKGIPDDIVLWGGDHRSLWPGQTGTTVHVLKDGEESFFEDWLDTYVYVPD